MTDDNATPTQAPDTSPDTAGEAPVPFPGTDAPTTPDAPESSPTTPDAPPDAPSLANPGGSQVKVQDGETLAQFAERVRKPVNYIMLANPDGVDRETLRITSKKLLVPEYDY